MFKTMKNSELLCSTCYDGSRCGKFTHGSCEHCGHYFAAAHYNCDSQRAYSDGIPYSADFTFCMHGSEKCWTDGCATLLCTKCKVHKFRVKPCMRCAGRPDAYSPLLYCEEHFDDREKWTRDYLCDWCEQERARGSLVMNASGLSTARISKKSECVDNARRSGHTP